MQSDRSTLRHNNGSPVLGANHIKLEHLQEASMKKIFALLFAVAYMCSSVSLADWKYLGNVGTTYQPHGVQVAPDGKIWVANYGKTKDTLGTKALSSIFVFNADGTHASFSPIKSLTIGGVTDTLVNAARGISMDVDGNMLYCAFDKLYRVNYKTGAGMTALKFAGSITAPGVDAMGEIFITRVANGLPIYILAPDFSSLGTVVDTSLQLSRIVAVSADGYDVYHGSVSGPGVLRYHCDNGSLGPYILKDTVFVNTYAETLTWDRKDKNILWTSSQKTETKYTKNTWYAVNVTTLKLVDSLKWSPSVDSMSTPRGMAFSRGGDTAYVVGFDGNAVQSFARTATSVTRTPNVVVSDFVLENNYPNPFNPSTTIKFSLPVASSISLKVYDVLGKEIATLAEGQYEAGAFTATFDAKNVNSGVYFYTLRTSNGFVQSNKMMLMK